jgi:DNA-binding NarL/FixJ family response regulator
MYMRLALIDDDITLLAQFKEMLAQAGVQVLFTAMNGEECLKLLEVIQPPEQPQLILMDIAMPKLNGIETTQQITAKYPHIQVVIFTTFEEDDKILACIQAGAKGYLLKTEAVPFILQTLEEVRQGGSLMSPSIARKVFRLLQQKNTLPATTTNLPTLTKRENEILKYVKEGKKYKQIGELLGIEENTVKKHIRHIYEKLDVHTQYDIITKFD